MKMLLVTSSREECKIAFFVLEAYSGPCVLEQILYVYQTSMI